MSPLASLLQSELDSVVQSASSALPKLDSVGHEAVASPELRPLNLFFVSKALLSLLVLGLEGALIGDRSTLI